MNLLKIDIIAGARPNFIKIAPIIDSIKRANKAGYKIRFRLIHTGQHFDNNMSGNFFNDLQIPVADFNLNAGGGTQSEQTAKIMIGYEQILNQDRSDLCLVVGDVTSTMACAIVAQKEKVKVAHVEGGIRSNDWNMPEEINRLVTDSITNYFFTTSRYANENLINSGVAKERIFFVGNTMIDSLLKYESKFNKPEFFDSEGLSEKKYIVLTLHRPSNVDDPEILLKLLNIILDSVNGLPVVFPIHPRTAKMLSQIKIKQKNLRLISPLGYFNFNWLVKNSKVVITDSGGITEEATVLGIPCLTIRENTERPETVTVGTNVLVGHEYSNIQKYLTLLFDGEWKKGGIPEMWDGKSSDRIVKEILKIHGYQDVNF